MVKQTLFTEADLSVLDEPKCLTEHQKPFFKCIKRTIFKPLFMTNKGLFVSDKGLFMTDKGLFEPNKGLFGSNKGLSVNKKVKIMTDLRRC
jgi:hypothetical protein